MSREFYCDAQGNFDKPTAVQHLVPFSHEPVINPYSCRRPQLRVVKTKIGTHEGLHAGGSPNSRRPLASTGYSPKFVERIFAVVLYSNSHGPGFQAVLRIRTSA